MPFPPLTGFQSSHSRDCNIRSAETRPPWLHRKDDGLRPRDLFGPELLARLRAQGKVILSLDGLQPQVGHEVLRIIREVISGEVLLARSLLSEIASDLVVLLREAARPIHEADRHARKELAKRLREVRTIERNAETLPTGPERDLLEGYCAAVRGALTDRASRPPLSAPGVKLQRRLRAIGASLSQIEKKGGFSPRRSPG